jgi:uncharacterized membrane protein YeaQ/YmgE (transglycosylase-associated protein family)
MSFVMFVTWVLVGVLAGLLAGLVMKPGGYGLKRDIILGLVGSIGGGWIFRAVGVFPGAGIVVTAVVAFIGAAILIVAQRTLRPTERTDEGKADQWWRWGLGAALVAVVAWLTLGPAPQPAATAAVIEDKTYTVTPAAMKVKAGIVTGEVTEMYIDVQGQPIKLEDNRTEPTLKFATYGNDRLDPGQEATQSLDVDFPAEALKAKKLREIRLDLAYIPSPYREETVNFIVSIGGR